MRVIRKHLDKINNNKPVQRVQVTVVLDPIKAESANGEKNKEPCRNGLARIEHVVLFNDLRWVWNQVRKERQT